MKHTPPPNTQILQAATPKIQAALLRNFADALDPQMPNRAAESTPVYGRKNRRPKPDTRNQKPKTDAPPAR